MGVNTKLIISNRWGFDDLSQVIKSYLPLEYGPRFRHWEHAPSSGSLHFLLKDGNEQESIMNYHPNYYTPLGPSTLLTMSAKSSPWKERNWNIFRTIGSVLGGVFCKAGNEEVWEIIDGLFFEEDGFSYHFKYAVLSNQLKIDQYGDDPAYATLARDLDGLKKSIDDWDAKINKGRSEK
jgi:hypothetical protein